MAAPSETIEIIKKGALRPGDRGAIIEEKTDGTVKARFREGVFTVDRGEFVIIERQVGDTAAIVKAGSLALGERGVIEKIQTDGDVRARFASGTFTVKGCEYVVVS